MPTIHQQQRKHEFLNRRRPLLFACPSIKGRGGGRNSKRAMQGKSLSAARLQSQVLPFRHLGADSNVSLMRRRQTRWNPRADSSATVGPELARRRQQHRRCKFRPDLLARFVFMKTDLPPAGRRFTSRRWNAINKGSLQSKRIVWTWQRRRARR